MRLLDDVRLIGSEILAPPIVSTFEYLSTWPASYELSDSWETLVHRSWNYDRRPSLAEKPWKNCRIVTTRVSEIRASKSLTVPVPKEHHGIEYRYSRVADNSSFEQWIFTAVFIGAYALIRHYLTTWRKYVLVKKYTLNKHLPLLTRLYGMPSASKYLHYTMQVC